MKLDNEANTTPRHLTYVTRRADRRIGALVNKTYGTRELICGSKELTDRDILWSAAKRLNKAERDEWITCPACRAKLEQSYPAKN